MILLLILVQLVLPLVLIAWLAFAPLRGLVALVVQVAATGFALLALAWSGMWILPPWWTPYLFGLLWVVAALLAASRGRWRQSLLPTRWPDWTGAALLLVLGGYAATVAVDAYSGRTPTTGVVDLASPLRGGPYLVTSGGSSEAVNAHMLTLDPIHGEMAAWRGQSYAVDILKVDQFGLRAYGLRPRDPTAYYIFGEPLYAPCAGTILHAEDGHPDLPVPETDRESMPGNHILFACGDAVVLMAHLREGSVAVEAGAAVAVGDPVGAVGNSGNTAEPHLHIHAQRLGTLEAPLAGEPLQIRLDGRFLVRNHRFDVSRAPSARQLDGHGTASRQGG